VPAATLASFSPLIMTRADRCDRRPVIPLGAARILTLLTRILPKNLAALET
jgi:hypothetical protein